MRVGFGLLNTTGNNVRISLSWRNVSLVDSMAISSGTPIFLYYCSLSGLIHRSLVCRSDIPDGINHFRHVVSFLECRGTERWSFVVEGDWAMRRLQVEDN
jgi:hypothetical protein